MLQENDKDLTFFLFLLKCFVLLLSFLMLLDFQGWGLKVKPITVFMECGVKRAFFKNKFCFTLLNKK